MCEVRSLYLIETLHTRRNPASWGSTRSTAMKRQIARTLVVAALVIAASFAVGTSVAHAQGFCYRVPAHASDVIYGPYGPVYVPCLHFVTVCY